MTTLAEIKQNFSNITLIKIFEVKVTDIRTKQSEYIIFDISIDKNNLIAQHIGLNYDEETSVKIAFETIELDDCYSLDENLQDLYEECINAIMQSEYFILTDY